jgi:hypothetical protein
MTSKAFSFSSGTWKTSYSLNPVVDDNQSSLSTGIYRWDISGPGIYEYTGSGYVLQYDVSQTEPWSTSSSVWGGNAVITRPTNTTVRVFSQAQNLDRGTWTETDAFVNGIIPTSTDQYGRLPSTAVSKSFAKARIKYRFDDGVTVDDAAVTVTGGYDTFNVPSEIFCPRTRTAYADYLLDLAKFNSVKLNTTRNGETYSTHFFGGALPNVLDATYQFVSLQAQAPFLSNTEWFINYKTYGFNIQNDSYDEIITGGSHNPAHSVLIRYNITTNTWVSNLGIVSFVNYPQFDYKILTISCVSPNSTEQWLGFSNLSFTTTNLLKFVVESETNASSDTTPPQSEIEVATTTSDGGGKPRRYPIISTNLFDRQKSIFSIGKTHKDETLF